MDYLLMGKSDLIGTGGIYHYSGLDTGKFKAIRYSDDLLRAVILTEQVNAPSHLQRITEEEFSSYLMQWSEPPDDPTQLEPMLSVDQRIENLKEVVDTMLKGGAAE